MSTAGPTASEFHLSSATETANPPRRRRGGLIGFLRDLVIILLAAFLISFLLKTFLIRSFYIPSGSMQHTLEIGDKIMVNQLVPNVMGVDRGDVVVFKDPGGWLNAPAPATPGPIEAFLQTIGLAADTSTEYVVKRVIGIGGDRVVCCDAQGRVSINGESIDEPYVVIPEGETAASKIAFDVTVPKGSVWMMGDNRYNSKDSRYHQDEPGRGFVAESEIVGRAFVINWPLNRFQWLGSYPDVFKNVPDPADAKG